MRDKTIINSMKKTIALILAVLMLVAVFAGCAAKTDDTAKESASETKTEEKEERCHRAGGHGEKRKSVRL